MKTAAKEVDYEGADMTADKHAEFQVGQSNAQTEATTWTITHIDCIVDQLKREIYDITSNEQMWFITALPIHLI